ADHAAEEDAGLLIQLNDSRVPLVSHCIQRTASPPEGRIPAAMRKLRKDRTIPLLISFSGWGSWKTALTPFKATRTREPLPSVSSAPRAKSRHSTSCQARLARTGSAKIPASTFKHLFFEIQFRASIVLRGSIVS